MSLVQEHKNFYGRYSVQFEETLALFTVFDPSQRGQVQLLSTGYDAVLCVDGESSWSFLKNEVPLKKGDFFFIPPGVYYHLINKSTPAIFIHLRFIDTKKSNFYEKSKLGVYSVLCEELKENFLKFGQEVITQTINLTPDERSVGPETIKNIKIFYESLTKYLHADASCIPEAFSISNEAHRQTVNSFFNTIKASDEITIQQACDSLGISTSYLARVFKNTFGITPRQYFNVLKINKSLTVIKGDVVNLSTVSLNMGFSDQSHFTNVFKRFMRITPGDLHKGTSLLL